MVLNPPLLLLQLLVPLPVVLLKLLPLKRLLSTLF